MKQLQVDQQFVSRFVVLLSAFLLQTPNSQQEEIESSRAKLRASLNPNATDFYCGICRLNCPIGQGVMLIQCSHHVCKRCLRATIKMNTDPEIRCPYAKTCVSCPSHLEHSEIRKLVTADEYKRFEQIGIKV